jgi:hypothetical protein
MDSKLVKNRFLWPAIAQSTLTVYEKALQSAPKAGRK